MEGSIRLTQEERKVLLKAYRAGSDARIARRAHVVLLRASGWTWEQIRSALFCSNDLITETMRWFTAGGVRAVLGQRIAPQPTPRWLIKVLGWINNFTPQDFGYFRSRWSCETLANLLAWNQGVRLSVETIRRGLHRLGLVWRRPRPILGPIDPERAEILRKTQSLLSSLPADEVAVIQDEVDVHLNPKIGPMWMAKGQQATVETPGNNRKCHVAGSLVWQTGTLLVSEPQPRRNAAMFIAHLDDLRCRLRGRKKIHVLCDNAKFHACRAVREYLARWGHRIEIHFLPKYAPDTNPIERVWWHLHETITRNHRCRTLEELVSQAYDWFETCNNHYLEMQNTFAKAA
jgi:putative transposase